MVSRPVFPLGWTLSAGDILKPLARPFRKNSSSQFAQARNGILAGDYTALDPTQTEINLKLTQLVEEWILRTMAQVHDFLEVCQGSQNLCATQKESRTQNN